jgi:hypothetical protein
MAIVTCSASRVYFDREPVILRTITTVILDDVLATCCLAIFVSFNLKMKEALEEILISIQGIFINFASN